MGKINIGKIKDFSNFNNSNEGIVLYKKDKLSMIYHEFTKNGISVWFNVISTRNIVHKTLISIDKEDNIINFSCSCNYRNIKNDNCKHIVSSYIFFINQLKNNLKAKISYNFDALDTMHNFKFENILSNADKYRLHYCININSTNDIRLDLGIILNKVYPISNIQKFLECILKSADYNINKNINLSFTEGDFEISDNLFINMMLDIYSLYDSNCILNSVFCNQYIILNERLFHSFMKIINEKEFSIKFDDKKFYERKRIDEDLDISPIISSDDNNNINLHLNISNIINLFDDSPYFYFDGNIYNTSKRFIQNYNCLKSIITDNNTSYFTIDENSKNKFLNNVIPKFSRYFKLKIDYLNKNTYVKCNPRFYIDRTSNDTIIIKPVFNYGELNINPLDTSQLNTSILRDYEKENKILVMLNNLCEYQNSIYYFINSPKKILEFKNLGIHNLKELGEIYYTKNFKEYKLISSSSYKTSFDISENNLLNISFSFDGITNEELYVAIKNIRKGEQYLKLKDKGILNLDNAYLNEINNILIDLDINEEYLKGDSLKVSKLHAFYLNDMYSESFRSLGELNKNANFLSIVSKLTNAKNIDVSPPMNLALSLRNYQIEGFKWLKTLKEYNFSGILADEMGLGKTIQTIAFLQKEFENNSLQNSIIICPKSLIYNWFDEIKKFAPGLKVLIYSGNKSLRLQLIETFHMYDIILTSYGIIQKDILQLKDKKFNICIIDEAQNIKNKISKNTLSLKELRINHKFALTGTPIENSIDELWSIFDFLMPGYLYSYSKFKSIYSKCDNINNLNKKISPFILRRLKKNVLTELPPKIETKIMVELNEEQKKLYYSYVEKFKNDFEKNTDVNLKFKILSALTRLRQICCEPKIILNEYNHGSSKMEILMEILENNIKNNKKVIVFSNFTSVLNIIKTLLIKNNIRYTYLDGSTPAKERIDIVNKFNKDDSNVFLISLKAGGFGLNITSVEIVVHFDPWWNNAVENQATDRAHRIGQKNVIQVIKLITKGTIEEKIFDIQHKKNTLIKSIIKDNELDYNLISKMSIDELKSLFSIDTL